MAQTDAENNQGRPLPGHETQSDEMACPACGRFVGAATKCPYCGAKVQKRMSLVALRWAAVLLSTVGLVLLYLMAKTRDPDPVLIGEITPTMNFGVVRISGSVRNDPRPFKNGNGMSFTVSDDSGSIIVFVDQAQRAAMAENGLAPRKGDAIDFVAQLQASSSGTSARIRSLKPSSFKLTRGGGAPAKSSSGRTSGRTAAAARDFGPAQPFSAVDESMVGKSVTLEGTVVALKEPEAGTKRPYVLTISDGAEQLDVKFWADQYAQIANPHSLTGTPVRVKASVKLYQEKVDLSLKKGSDLQRVVPAAETSVSAVTAELVGQTVTVCGSVARIDPPKKEKAPWSVTLADPDSGARLAVKYWDDAREAFARQPAVGDVFEFTGEVGYFAGKLQLKVSSGAKAKFVSEGAPKKPATPVAEVAAATAGAFVTIEGALSEPADLDGKGTAYTLTDGTGSVQVVFWNSSIPDELRQKAAAAPRVRVNGKVGDYKGTRQVVPKAGGLEIPE